MNNGRYGRRGFTLTELVAVVAILAILTAVAVPAAGSFLDGVRQQQDAAAAQNLESAVRSTAAELSTLTCDPDLFPYTVDDDTLEVTFEPVPLKKVLLNATMIKSLADAEKTLTPRQKGFSFWFDKASQKVLAAAAQPAGNWILMTPDTTLGEDGLSVCPETFTK